MILMEVNIKFLFAYWKTNLKGAMEFRWNFILQTMFTIINNGVWIFFWWIFFERFPSINGWNLNDIVFLWAISSSGFGIIYAFFGNSFRLSNIIANGEIDVYLTMPKPVLLHILIGKMNFSAWGDIIFSWLLILTLNPNIKLILLFIIAQALCGFLILSIMIIVQSLSFYIGNSEEISSQVLNTLLTFTTYPIDIFKGLSKVILFTILPAGFISSLPIQLIELKNYSFLIKTSLVVFAFMCLAIFVFYTGLKKYESGNTIHIRM